ncbi:MAG TPA: hypothetical protein VGG64_30435 [Pirellulales bacterium]|jgi:hypothetical protein
MRTNIIRNTQIAILANCQDWIVVAAADVVRTVTHAQPTSGHLSQVLVGFTRALKRAMKPAAAAAAHAVETTLYLVVSSMRGLSRCWHTLSVMPHLAVVRVGS